MFSTTPSPVLACLLTVVRLLVCLLLAAPCLAMLAASPAQAATKQKPPKSGEDDWIFEAEFAKVHGNRPGGSGQKVGAPAARPSPMMRGAGLAVGGAKDSVNFRDNIAKGFLPLVSDVTDEGLFYDYAFATGGTCEDGALFCPTALTRTVTNPETHATEPYLAIGLASGLSADAIPRRPLNLMLVLDVSGSMGAPFDTYYYDSLQRPRPPRDGDAPGRQSKIKAAGEALIALLDQLGPEDRFGLVLFDNFAYTALTPRRVAERDMAAIKDHIRALTPLGGTNLDAGLTLATAQLGPEEGVMPSGEETRLIVMTDAMPNLGQISDAAFLRHIKDNAGRGLFTTVIGVGLDFNTELVQTITRVRGANYYAVHAPQAFRDRLGSEFLGMVTPLAFDLALGIESQGFAVDAVYGSPEADSATGRLVRVNTLFPAPTTEDGSRGGIILVRLRQTGKPAPITLTASYLDRAGRQHQSRQVVTFAPDGQAWGEASMRKAILLTRYADLLRQWIGSHRPKTPPVPPLAEPRPITVAPPVPGLTGRPAGPMEPSPWERRSLPLVVTTADRARFTAFLAAFDQELPACKDPSLARERVVLETLIHAQPRPPAAQTEPVAR